MISRMLTLLGFVLLTNSSFAQKINNVPAINIKPMHIFLQKNADTTIVFSYVNSFVNTPSYSLLSKKGDTITLYSYDSGYKRDLKIPSKIGDSLYKLNRPFESFEVGINRFFSAVNISQDKVQIFWLKASNLNLFQIKDDSVNGVGCPKTNTSYDKNIYDGGGIEIYLITRGSIKRLYFYAPQYYEKEACPGREDRKAIIKLEELFSTYFKQ